MSAVKKWISLQGLPVMLRRLLLIGLGLWVFIYPEVLKDHVHFVVGSAALLISLGMLTGVLGDKGYDDPNDTRLPASLLGLALGAMILIRKHDSIPFIAIAWGLQGMSSGVTELHHAFCRKRRHQRFVAALLHGLLETVLSLLLVFDPMEEIELHIVLLGAEMMVQGFETTRKHTTEAEEA